MVVSLKIRFRGHINMKSSKKKHRHFTYIVISSADK